MHRHIRESIGGRVLTMLFALAAGIAPAATRAAQPSMPPPVHVAGVTAPNVVVMGPELVTAGQPTRESLQGLAAEGYSAVIYLAPGDSAEAVKDERQILEKQGIEFVHVPVPWQAPEAHHFASTAAALQRLKGRKVLLHCQMNMRASAFAFLYRAIHLREDPARAWADVKALWTPHGQWARFIDEQLSAASIPFKAE